MEESEGLNFHRILYLLLKYNSLNILCYLFHNLNCKYVFSKFLVDHGCIILHPVGEVLLASTSLIIFCCRDGLCFIGCFRTFLASTI